MSTPRTFQATSALLLVGVQLIAAVGVLLLGAAVSGGESVGVVFLLAVPVVAPLVAVYVGLLRYAPEEGTAAALRLGRPDGWGLVLLALLFGFALSPVMVWLQELVVRMVPAEPLTPELEYELHTALAQPATVGFLSLSQMILAPVALESLFRGFIQPRLIAAHGLKRGFWITVFLFAATRMDPGFLPVAVLLGVPFGVIAIAAGNTWAPIAAHLGMMIAEPHVASGWPDWTVPACGAAALVLLAAIWRARR